MMGAVAEKYEELDGLRVTVDRVDYMPDAPTPPDRPYQFVYHITIHNMSARTVTLVGRKWVVTNAAGHKRVAEGDGLVGQFPRLSPGDQFHYNSYHLVDSDSVAEGAYLGKDENNRPILVRIPPFRMNVAPR
jgi:ApaG protein